MDYYSAQFIVRRSDGISEENAQTLRISLGGASALTGHRQDARLVRIDAGAVPGCARFF